MSNVSQSPSPNNYAIRSFFSVHGRAYDAVIEYCADEADATGRMRHWAAYHGVLDRLSVDGCFFDRVDDGGNVVTFRVEPVALDDAAPAGAQDGREDETVEIDGRAYQVTDRLGIDELPARAAEGWRRNSVVAHVEVRRPRGSRTYVARQYADGGFSRPWRGSLVAA